MRPLIRIRPSFDTARRRLLCVLACLLPATARADLWITGYYPGYRSSQMAPSNIDFTIVTHVIHFALVPASNGTIDSNANSLTAPACAQLVGAAHTAGRKALVCVGGAGTETDFLADTTPANLGPFVTNIVSFMSGNGYDGVDLDWEPFNSADAAQYTNLVNGLRAALNGFGTHKLLAVAAPAYAEYGDSPTAEFTMLASVQGQFDQINIMTYDLSGPYEGWVTWFNSPIYDGGYTFPSDASELVPSINGAVSNFVNNGVAPGKLGVGLPFYGYVWTGGPGMTQPRQCWPTNDVPTAPLSPTRALSTLITRATSIIGTPPRRPLFSASPTPRRRTTCLFPYDDAHACQAKVSYAAQSSSGRDDDLGVEPGLFFNRAGRAARAVDHRLETGAGHAQHHGDSIRWNRRRFEFFHPPARFVSRALDEQPGAGAVEYADQRRGRHGTNVPVADPAPATVPGRFYRIQTPP